MKLGKISFTDNFGTKQTGKILHYENNYVIVHCDARLHNLANINFDRKYDIPKGYYRVLYQGTQEYKTIKEI